MHSAPIDIQILAYKNLLTKLKEEEQKQIALHNFFLLLPILKSQTEKNRDYCPMSSIPFNAVLARALFGSMVRILFQYSLEIA